MLDEIDYDTNVFNSAGREADKNLAVRFYTTPIRDDIKSLEEGRPIFVDTEMVEIRVRGDRNNIVQRPAREDDRRRFREPYRAFKDELKQAETGTLLAEWPIVSRSMVEEMKYFGFHTVEQVAEATDGVCSKMPGLQTLKQKAKIFLEHAKGGAPMEKLSKELEERDGKIAVLESSNSELQRQLDVLTKKFTDLAEKAATKK